MSAIPKQPTQPPKISENLASYDLLGDLVGATIKGAGAVIYGTSCYLAERISLTKHGEKVNEFRERWKKHEQVALQVCFIVGALYCCWTNCLFFSLGVVVGFLATAPLPLIGLDFLKKYPMSGWNKEHGYMIQKTMGIIFALNLFDFIKNPIVDNMLFGGLAGFVVGFTINRIVEEKFEGSYRTFCKSAQEAANSLIVKAGLEEYIAQATVIEEEVPASAEERPPKGEPIPPSVEGQVK